MTMGHHTNCLRIGQNYCTGQIISLTGSLMTEIAYNHCEYNYS